MEHEHAAPRKRHVLVVDDDLELAEVFRQLLETHDYEASTAANGILALKEIFYQEVDAIICDLKMPELEGDLFYSTVERVKPGLCSRFIFITGLAEDPKYHAFLSHVKSPVLRKPVPPDRLLEALRKVLAQSA